MAITYTWNFSSFKVKPLQNKLKDVISSYEWRRIATDSPFSVDVYGSISLPDPNPKEFTEYNKLKKSDVETWTINQLTEEVVQSYDTSLASSIQNLKNPPLVNKSAPWDAVLEDIVSEDVKN